VNRTSCQCTPALAAWRLIGVLGVAPAAFAQSPDTTRSDTARTLKAVTVTETRAAATTGGASAVVVRTEELRASPAPLLEEALRESPFVHVRQNSRGEMELSVRGSDSRQAAVLMDGVPLSIGWDHRVDPSLVPITGAQNLVIVRGLASLLNGPNTLGGSIEVSHENAFGKLGTGRVWGGAGVDEYGAYVASLGAGRRLASGASGEVSVRGGFAHRQRDGFSLAAGTPDPTASDGLRTNSDLRETDGFATLRWSGAMGRGVGLLMSGSTVERGVPPEEHIASPRLWRYPGQQRLVAALSGSAGSFATPFGYGTFDVGVGYNAGRLKIQSFSDRTYNTITAEELGDERTWTARAQFSHSLPAQARLKTAVTFANVGYAETLPADTAVDYGQRLTSVGAELEVPLFRSTMLATGVVYDRSVTPRTGGRAPQPAMDNLGWRAGLTQEMGTDWTIHASASQRSRFPSLRELYSGALNRFMPNPGLRPETLLGFETGITVDRSLGAIPDATMQLNAFHHRLSDAVVRVTLPPPDRRFLRVNRDRIESTGIEMLAGLAFSRDRERSVTLTGDALVQDITITDVTVGTPRHAENNPEARGMIELGIPMPARARGFANARYTGRQYCLNSDTGGEMELAGRTEANLAVERRFQVSRAGSIRSLRALLALDNAGNVAVYDQCGLPQPGRTLRLMFTFQ